MNRYQQQILIGLAGAFILATADAQQPTETIEQDGVIRTTEQQWSHVGLLRARDLTPFGLLRLDMLPAHTADAQAGSYSARWDAIWSHATSFSLSIALATPGLRSSRDTNDGFGDPVIGLRYSLPAPRFG